ncbi:hypothetical protein MIR68_009972 [Amoeboaphelidium protococcarum]|nr:hypothetical protein MIR68_009972 [Amoeboaphelidium protococcarum]
MSQQNSQQSNSGSSQQSIDLAFRLICKNCKKNPPNIVEDYRAGDLVCGDCGLVYPGRIIDMHSEWRSFNDDNGNGGDDPSRIGQAENPLMEGVIDHLSTSINRSVVRNAMTSSLSRMHGKVSGTVKGDKDMMDSFKVISNLCERASLPKVVADRSKQLYKKIWDADLQKKKNNQHLIAGCLFIACRQEAVGRTFAEISKVTQVEIGYLKKAVNLLLNFLKQQHAASATSSSSQQSAPGAMQSSESQAHVAGASAELLVPRLCAQLGLDAQFSQAVQMTVKNIEQQQLLTGRNPNTIAGSTVLLLVKLSATLPEYDKEELQTKLPKIVQLSEYTIRKALKILEPAASSIIPKSFKVLPGEQSTS